MTMLSQDIETQQTWAAEAPTMVSIRNLTKVFPTRSGEVTALSDVNIDVYKGEVLVLLGPSGCGKTTLLRCVAGLEYPTVGEITVHGRTVFSSSEGILLPPEKRDLSMVFQSYALWPHMTVAENVGYPLKVSKVDKDEIAHRVEAVLTTCGLKKFINSYPGQLSGGQQQRVALARALVSNDGLILFDEPLSNLDAKVREHLRDELIEMQQHFGFTAIYVTHDQIEAAALASRVAVMEVGRAAQLGQPMEIFQKPRDPFIADFVGLSNELKGTVAGVEGDVIHVDTAIGRITGTAVEPELSVGDAAVAMFRPEHLRLDRLDSPVNNFDAVIDRSLFMGSHVENIMHVGKTRLVSRSMKGAMLTQGSRARVTVDAESVRVFRPSAHG